MCERCKPGDVKVGDVVWRAVIDYDLDTDAPIVEVASARITARPNKHLDVRIAPKLGGSGCFGYKHTVRLRELAHSKRHALLHLSQKMDAEAKKANEAAQCARAALFAEEKLR